MTRIILAAAALAVGAVAALFGVGVGAEMADNNLIGSA